MRRRMQDLSAGVFEYEGPKIKLSDDRLMLTATEGEDLKGAFTIESTNGINMRGIVYSNNPRMELKEPQFSGTCATIEYRFHTDGLIRGDIQKGDFYIILNKNEYSLPFVVETRRAFFKIGDATIDSLESFLDAAKKDQSSAFCFFSSPMFNSVLDKEDQKASLAARLLSYEKTTLHNMEELFTLLGYKEEMVLTTDFEDLYYENPTESIREIIELKKSEYGFAEVDVRTDVGFIALPRGHFYNEDFIGSTLKIPFFLDIEKLHAGMNYGRIKINSGRFEFIFNIIVHANRNREKEKRELLDKQETVFNLMSTYIDYRVGRILTASFSTKMLMILDHAISISEDTLLLWLFKAQVFSVSNRPKEAQWVLDQYKNDFLSAPSDIYGYYLYVTTFLNREPAYIKKVADKIKTLYKESERDELLFYCLLFLDESFKDSPLRKYRAIKDRVMNHQSSPMLLAEAYHILKDNVSVLEEVGTFEVRLFCFIRKYGLMQKEMILMLSDMISMDNLYNKSLIPVLIEGFDRFDSDRILIALCKMLIRKEHYDRKANKYYLMAIERELNIPGLFEAYIMSAPNNVREAYPKMVSYYFQFKTNLPYKHKAIVYAGMINNRDKQEQIYLKCKPEIEEFAVEQIYAGHLDENLAVIYEHYLKEVSITHELSRALSPLLYIHKLIVFDKPYLKRVICIHRQTNKEMSYPIIDGVAYLPIYSKEHLIAFEDAFGNRYIYGIDYDLQILIRSDALTKKCLKVAPEQMPYLIHYIDSIWKSDNEQMDFTDNDLSYLNILLSSNVITDDYKHMLRPQIIDFYYRTERIELLDEYLKSLDFEGLDEQLRILATELLVTRGFYDKAFNVIVHYGCNQIAPSLMLILCSNEIIARNYEADDYLIGLCTNAFLRGKYNEVVLTYLCKYMYGATDKLYDLWIAANEYEINTFELSERLLVQMIYSEVYIPKNEEILRNYIEQGGKKLVLDAYLSYHAYKYLVKESMYNQLTMMQLLEMYEHKMKLNICEKLALLKYLAETESDKIDIIKELYDFFTLKGYDFAFFNELPKAATVDFPRDGRKILEYRTNPGRQVYLRYRVLRGHDNEDTAFVKEQMTEMYEGIFVKEFVLFYGDSVQYYISESNDYQVEIKLSGEISNMDIRPLKENTRFEILNDLIISEQLGELSLYESKKKRYDMLLTEAGKRLKRK
ncbi:MAG: hypothetical protein IJT81_00660 [Lachnospiraceae bacterium]|nr:hypothetical protein [Lachnospiraceae bacterium]